MRVSAARLVVATVVSAPLAAALFVTPNSPCSKYCGNVQSSTARDEMPCDGGTLKKTSTGLVFEQCIDCLLTSTHVSGSQTDLQALLCMCGFPSWPRFPTDPMAQITCGLIWDTACLMAIATPA
jgi:hypothetical protein